MDMTQVAIKHVRITQPTATSATLFIDDVEVYAYESSVVDPLRVVLYFLTGYMSECQHKPMCTLHKCTGRTHLPFTFQMGAAD